MGRLHKHDSREGSDNDARRGRECGRCIGGGGGAIFHADRPEFLVKCTQRALRAKQSKKKLPLKGQCRREIPNRIEGGLWTQVDEQNHTTARKERESFKIGWSRKWFFLLTRNS